MTCFKFYTRLFFSLLFVSFGFTAKAASTEVVIPVATVQSKPIVSQEQKDIFRSYKKEQFFSNIMFAAAMHDLREVPDFLSDVFVTMLVRKIILRTTPIKKISIPLLFTAIGGKKLLDFAIAHGKRAPSFRNAYTQHFGTSSGWMWYYLRNKIIPGTIKKFAVGTALTGLAGLATYAGLSYPSWVSKSWITMLLAMQVPVFAQEAVSTVYDAGYDAITSAI